MTLKITLVFFLFFVSLSFSQKGILITNQISENLLENTNSVVLSEDIIITIKSQKKYTCKTHRVVKVFNEYGLRNIDASEYYSKSSKINSIDAVMYNQFGEKIKDFKQKDFKDQAVLDGYTIVSDGRFVHLQFTPTKYPFIIDFTSETESENTAFLPTYYPIKNTFESVLSSNFTINFPTDLGFKFKEINFENYTIDKTENTNSITYSTKNILAVKKEEYAPSFDKIIPHVLFGLENFYLEGVEGTATSWKEFGLWMNSNLLKNSEVLNDETKQKIISLIGDEQDPIKKAKIIYQYVQDKTRYVSIQLGIGGWKPMLAKDVDRLGYGDCKALSNYTRSLLKLVGVESFYTIIYGDTSKKDINKDFVSMQGNHAILAIPTNDKMTFLECTSQTKPFGFEGDFTDDRNVLIVKPDGGEIVKTNNYNDKLSCQKMQSSYNVEENGTINCTINVKSKGIQYSDKYEIEKESVENINKHYKEHFDALDNLIVENVKFDNNKDAVEFTENIKCKSTNYASINGNSLLFPINAFNQFNQIPQRYRNRISPLEINRGFFDEDEIEIQIPENYVIDAKPNNFDINDKFGEYKTEITIISPSKIKYKRSMILKKGRYDKSEYENFRKFVEQIAKADNSKIVITKKA